MKSLSKEEKQAEEMKRWNRRAVASRKKVKGSKTSPKTGAYFGRYAKS
jgi:hypothetical protein